jgi:hypothetical protein
VLEGDTKFFVMHLGFVVSFGSARGLLEEPGALDWRGREGGREGGKDGERR